MDYNLRGLGETHFEQLVQALALAELGPGVQVFGRGPDGGREATFRDLAYQDQRSGSKWTGFGVLQAKFVDVSDSDTALGTKAFMVHVRKEIADWEKRKNTGRQVPENLLFATPARLSAVAGSGGIDTFYSEADELVRAHGLPIKRYDVWDYTKICALLTNHPAIRDSYLGLIAPGDLISAMMQVHQQRLAASEGVLVAYLGNEITDEEVLQVGEIGESDTGGLRLSEIFVDLPLKDATRKSEKQPWTIRELLDRFDGVHRNNDPAQLSSRVVIVGGPGQGKTTVGRYLAQLYRASILRGTSGRVTDRVADVVRSVETARERLELNAPINRRWPFRVVLSEYAELLKASGQDASIGKFILEQLNHWSGGQVSISDLLKWLSHWPTIFIFDGMDEVSVALRGAITRDIDKFENLLASFHADYVFLATTRPQRNGTDFNPHSWNHEYLELLDKSTAIAYAIRLAELRIGNPGRLLTKFSADLQQAILQPATERLMRTPLQVAIMTLLLERRSRLPGSKAELFEAYFSTIYAREETKPHSIAAILIEMRVIVEEIIHTAAFVLQLRGESVADEGARIDDEELHNIIKGVLRKYGNESDNVFPEVLSAVTDRLVLLVAAQEGTWEFEVRSLQEYMTARGWTNGLLEIADLGVVLEKTAPSTYWRNVWLFVAGRAARLRPEYMEQVISAIAAANHADDLSRITRPAGQLATEVLLDGSFEIYPKYTRMLLPIAVEVCFVVAGDSPQALGEKLGEMSREPNTLPHVRDAVARLVGNEMVQDGAVGFFDSLSAANSVFDQDKARFIRDYKREPDWLDDLEDAGVFTRMVGDRFFVERAAVWEPLLGTELRTWAEEEGVGFPDGGGSILQKHIERLGQMLHDPRREAIMIFASMVEESYFWSRNWRWILHLAQAQLPQEAELRPFVSRLNSA